MEKIGTLLCATPLLANLTGTTPETVSRMLKKMTDAGLIQVELKEIAICDFDKLFELSVAGKVEFG